ncbi:MAG: acyltransferase [Patescibacteria group bacterium]
MQIQVAFPIEQTVIFSLVLFAVILVSFRKKKEASFFPLSVTNELKGFGILAVIFSHIGYFLSTNTSFLFPLSTVAGVGVDLFLFLSGYGLAISAFNKKLLPWQFYKKRLTKLFLPLWVIVALFLILDWLLLKKFYPLAEVAGSFLGYFPQADIFLNFNSPLWYFTLIFFFYLIFPWVFDPRRPTISAIMIAVLSYLILLIDLPVTESVLHLYKLHYLAFPLGVLFAAGFCKISFWQKFIPTKLEKILYRLTHLKTWGRILVLIILGAVIAYFFINSGVGKKEIITQTISLITAFGLVLFFLIKKGQFKILTILGIYSYEIYLIHWPILYRYDIFYKFFPAAIATILYLISFVGLGWLLHKIQHKILKKLPGLN